MIDEKNFGNRLTECMRNAGYTNKKITETLNLSKNAIGNYKNNQIPNAIILFNISQLLGTSMEYLLTGKSETEELTLEEQKVIENYRNADPAIKIAIRKLLDVPDIEKLSKSKTG